MYPSDSQSLPFFPNPYPGESLYSILCRYHVRSGNISPHRTIRQLFGSYDSLISTLLLPPRLDRLKCWIHSGNEYSAETILREHTAFSLCKLRTFSEYQYTFSGADLNSVFSKRLRNGTFRQPLIQHPSHELRYCPQCAFEQKKVYGESYWQILPQLDGVEFCPVHRIRIVSSSIPISRIQHAFLPADTVLPKTDPPPVASNQLWYSNSHIDTYPDLFFSMAKTVLYLWENLPRFSGIWFLLCRYRSCLSVENAFWQSTECVRTKLLEKNPPSLVNWLLNRETGTIERRLLYFNNFMLSEHAMMISMLAESPQAFFS